MAEERTPLLGSLRNGSVFRTPSIKDEEEDYLAASSIGERLSYSYQWSKWFCGFRIIKDHPVLEVAFVVVLTGLTQWPNVFTRIGGDELIREMLVDCQERGVDGVLCLEAGDGIGRLVGLLTSGIVIKLLLTSVWIVYGALM